MKTILKYIVLLSLISSGKTYCQTHAQMEILDFMVNHIRDKGFTDTVLVTYPFEKIQRKHMKGMLERERNGVKIIDCKQCQEITNGLSNRIKRFSKVTLDHTKMIDLKDIDSLRAFNLVMRKENMAKPDTTKLTSITYTAQYGMKTWYNLSIPALNKSQDFAIVRLGFSDFYYISSEYIYLLLQKKNSRWVIVKRLASGHLCF